MLTIHWQWNLILFCHVVMFHWVLLGFNITIGHDHVKCWWHSSIIQHALGWSLAPGHWPIGLPGGWFHWRCTVALLLHYHVFT